MVSNSTIKAQINQQKTTIVLRDGSINSKRTSSVNNNSRRELLLFSALPPLLFLPIRGCTEGGFYDTGVTENCQKLYQPAAAAEERLRRRLAGETAGGESLPASTQSLPPTKSSTTSTDIDDKAQLMQEQKEYERIAMQAEREKQTRAIIDNMWQSLE